MIVRFLLATIVAGLLGGGFFTFVQQFKVIPIIVEAETYENAGAKAETLENHSHAVSVPAVHEHDADAWAPQDGFERLFYSLLANSITGVAYSLLLAAGILLSKQSISPRSGMIWGAAGFVIFVLAPGLGLPPEVPGTVAASVMDRQVWWTFTVVATAIGLGLFAFKSSWPWIVIGVAVIVAPHIYGAPQPVHHESLAPANLAAEFVIAAVVSAGMFWLFLGAMLGWLLPKAIAFDNVDAS